MKTISNPIIWILLVLITSCTSIEEPGLKDETSSQTATRSLSLEDPHEHSTMAQREAIALWFANNYSLREAKRVHMAITSAVANGIDEILYLKELDSSCKTRTYYRPSDCTARTLNTYIELC